MSTHTPGIHHAIIEKDTPPIIVAEDGTKLATVHYGGGRFEVTVQADAKLYAAAPALLAELRSQHDKLMQELNSRIPMSERDRDRFVRIEKLIALAEGGAG
jgi:hypothetical protein